MSWQVHRSEYQGGVHLPGLSWFIIGAASPRSRAPGACSRGAFALWRNVIAVIIAGANRCSGSHLLPPPPSPHSLPLSLSLSHSRTSSTGAARLSSVGRGLDHLEPARALERRHLITDCITFLFYTGRWLVSRAPNISWLLGSVWKIVASSGKTREYFCFNITSRCHCDR
jgi:hypothetical protein